MCGMTQAPAGNHSSTSPVSPAEAAGAPHAPSALAKFADACTLFVASAFDLGAYRPGGLPRLPDRGNRPTATSSPARNMADSVCRNKRMSDGDLAFIPGTTAASSETDTPPDRPASHHRCAHSASAARTTPRGRPIGRRGVPCSVTKRQKRCSAGCDSRAPFQRPCQAIAGGPSSEIHPSTSRPQDGRAAAGVWQPPAG